MAISLSDTAMIREKAVGKTAEAIDRMNQLQLGRRLGMMLLLAGAVAIGLMVFFWSQKPDMVQLYTGADDKATAEATELLRTAGIPFEVDAATGAISVPGANVHDARLKLAGAGAADSGRLGFELMERDPGFGVSQFMETARYQHALETELVRTITTMRQVRDARVHLAIPKPSAFTRQREAASASVMLELRSGGGLERDQVNAIVHMVASSIPDLSPERVTVVDQNGHLLSESDKDPQAELSATQFEQVRRQETEFSDRIQQLLQPLTGANRVNAKVNVDMDFSTSEEARELFNGEPPKLRSEQVTSSSNTTAAAGQGPVPPGATANTPPTPGAIAASNGQNPADANRNGAPAAGETSNSANRNYELDRTLQHTSQPPGRIRRVSVAVLVDHVPRPGKDGKTTLQPLNATELQRVEDLIKQAVGYDDKRGDMVSVMNAQFVREDMPPAEKPAWWEDPRVRDALRLVLGAIVVLAVLFGVARPAMRQIFGSSVKKQDAQTPELADVTLVDDDMPALGEDTARLSSPQAIALPSSAYEDKLRLARDAVRSDSRQVAQVVKGWLDDES
ncbi:flagellar basal-body MS-ring/collar protein FliF [Pseudoxanthomonas composti]|uniref:Flagellar M-ring protein n=1 Tax=Pseudoxanthomonas composti TaxID=2137479 RepID=A0A4Q1JTZ0_9GAMM|nr:flagellar basal-body MS-ring/collar protein FliF [Pseudoxanthomonas composti]RXR02652.1 flagellar M-ring protein FliF [Pseudoxanthomonas composti]